MRGLMVNLYTAETAHVMRELISILQSAIARSQEQQIPGENQLICCVNNLPLL